MSLFSRPAARRPSACWPDRCHAPPAAGRGSRPRLLSRWSASRRAVAGRSRNASSRRRRRSALRVHAYAAPDRRVSDRPSPARRASGSPARSGTRGSSTCPDGSAGPVTRHSHDQPFVCIRWLISWRWRSSSARVRAAKVVSSVQAGHAAVRVHDLADHGHRLQSGEGQRSTEASVCPARLSTPPGAAASGKTWPGRARSSGRVAGVDGELDRLGAVGRGDPRGDIVAGLDRNAEGRAAARCSAGPSAGCRVLRAAQASSAGRSGRGRGSP